MSFEKILSFTKQAAADAAPLFLAYLLLRILWLLLQKRQPRKSLSLEAAKACFVFYLLLLFQITVVRGKIVWNPGGLETVQLVPLFYTLLELQNGLWAFVYPVVGNLLWFLPLGFFLPLLFHFPLSKAVVTGAFTSLTIECMQWLLGSGISDIDDILFNTFGTFLGYMLFLQVSKKIPTAFPFDKKLGQR